MKIGRYLKVPCERCCGTGNKLDSPAVGRKVRAERKGLGLSMAEFGRLMFVSEAYLCDLELGKREWNHTLVKAAVKALKEEAQRKANAGMAVASS